MRLLRVCEWLRAPAKLVETQKILMVFQHLPLQDGDDLKDHEITGITLLPLETWELIRNR